MKFLLFMVLVFQLPNVICSSPKAKCNINFDVGASSHSSTHKKS